MGILNSIGQVISNRKNFKTWEENQNDNNARRKALAQTNPKSAQELEKAKRQGKVIMDIIDIMDAHSEDVAENTETATVPFQALVPYFATLLSSAISGKFVMFPAQNALNKAYSEFVDSEQVKNLVKKVAEYARKNNIEELEYFYGFDFLSKNKMDLLKNIDDDEIKTVYKTVSELVEQYKNNPAVKNYGKKLGLTVLIPIGALISSFVASTIFATKLQVNSSRIARWQSREQLKDPKYFVEYTPEQIEKATQIVEQKEKEQKGFSLKLFNKKEKASLIQVIKDNKKYKEWKKTDKDESKLVQRELSQEELQQAQKDKEVIQRITKIINNKAEDYSENMEVAADTLIVGTPFLGSAVGAIIGFIGNKTGILDKVAKGGLDNLIKDLDKTSADKIKKAQETLKNLAKGTPEYKKATTELIGSILSASFANTKGTKSDEILKKAKKILNAFMSTKLSRNVLFGIVGGIITTTFGLIISLKLQKASARAGRFLAKRELEKDPNNFIGYSDEELKSVQDVKAQKRPFGERFKEYITFLPRVIGEYFDYQKYLKTTAAKNRAIREELIKTDVTDEQLREAKNLQRKMFNTFEKVDDKSQEYSESIEAATEIAKPAVAMLGMFSLLSPALFVSVQLARGKIKAGNVLEKVSKFLSDKTGFLKGKIIGKYLDNVNQNIIKGTQKMSAATTDVASEIKINKADFFEGIKSMLEIFKDSLKDLDPQDFNKAIDSMKLPVYLKHAMKESSPEQVLAIIENFEKIGKNIPQDKLNEILDSYIKMAEKNPQGAAEFLKDPKNLRNIFITKDVAKYGSIAASTWSALTLGLTYALESYLASMQKRAGRLGVMKAMEELDDPRYYANIEPKQTTSEQEQTEIKNNKYLL